MIYLSIYQFSFVVLKQIKGLNKQNAISVANYQATRKNVIETIVLLVTVLTERDKNIASGFYRELVFQFSDIASDFASMLFLVNFTHQ